MDLSVFKPLSAWLGTCLQSESSVSPYWAACVWAQVSGPNTPVCTCRDLDAPLPVAQSNDTPLRTAHFREGAGFLDSLPSDLTGWLEYL